MDALYLPISNLEAQLDRNGLCLRDLHLLHIAPSYTIQNEVQIDFSKQIYIVLDFDYFIDYSSSVLIHFAEASLKLQLEEHTFSFAYTASCPMVLARNSLLLLRNSFILYSNYENQAPLLF